MVNFLSILCPLYDEGSGGGVQYECTGLGGNHSPPQLDYNGRYMVWLSFVFP